MQIDRCDQLTNYLSKFQAPSSASTAASNGPSSEVASIDGYKVGKLLCHPPQQCCLPLNWLSSPACIQDMDIWHCFSTYMHCSCLCHADFQCTFARSWE